MHKIFLLIIGLLLSRSTGEETIDTKCGIIPTNKYFFEKSYEDFAAVYSGNSTYETFQNFSINSILPIEGNASLILSPININCDYNTRECAPINWILMSNAF